MTAGMEDNDTLMVVREAPWHNHPGTIILETAPLDVETALAASRMAWEVETMRLGYIEPLSGSNVVARYLGKQNPFRDDVAPGGSPIMGLVRKDTGELLGTCTPDYSVFQNRQKFDWLDGLLGSDLEFVSAGTIKGGRRVYVLAKVPEYMLIGGDKVEQFIFITGGHDGMTGVDIGICYIRMVCQNTLEIGLTGAQHHIHFKHTGDVKTKAELAGKLMQLSIASARKVRELGDKLAAVQLGETEYVDYIKSVYEPPVFNPGQTHDMKKRAISRYAGRLDLLREIYHGKTKGNSPGTGWAAYNAVVEHQDWYRGYKPASDQMLRSFVDTEVKVRALNNAIDMFLPSVN